MEKFHPGKLNKIKFNCNHSHALRCLLPTNKINFTVLEKHHVEGVEASIKPQAYNLTHSRLNGKSITRNQVIYRDRCQHSRIIFIQTLRCIKLQWFHFFLMTSKSHYNTLWTALKHARVGKFKLYPLSVNERHF